MPELPDITIYLEALERRVMGQTLKQVRIASPFLLRTAVPPLQRVHGRKVVALRRLGKRIGFGFEDDLWLVVHLMIAGRLHWRQVHTANVPGASPSGREKATAGRVKGLANIQAAFDFPNGTLFLTEAGTKKRASLHLVQGADSLSAHDPGGLEVLAVALDTFAQALTSRNHTLKRALTDPRLFSGIGNAYSDEILHRARLSPVTLTQKLSPGEIARLHRATQETLSHWIELLRQKTGDRFPENVTAFRPEMAVHGKFGKPCPTCGARVQRIRYADNETNYCPSCQTGGRLLADRSLSLLLKKDWPKSLEELEEMQARRVGETHRSTHPSLRRLRRADPDRVLAFVETPQSSYSLSFLALVNENSTAPLGVLSILQRRDMKAFLVIVTAAIVSLASSPARAAEGSSRLPQGPGLAAQYPGDAGIERDPQVLLHEDFESGTIDDLGKRWESVSNEGRRVLAFTDAVPPSSAGKRSLQTTATVGENTGGHLYQRLPREVDLAFARFYVKFAAENDYTHHFVHFGGYRPSTPWPQGGAGERPRGDERITVGIEPFGEYGKYAPPGAWFFYSYWHEMKISADDKYWGNGLRPAEPQRIPKDIWQCVEVMVQLNSTPDKHDGELALWLDGKLVAHFAPGAHRGPWSGMGYTLRDESGEAVQGFNFRTSTDLKINFFWLLHYVTENAARQNKIAKPNPINRVWFDDIVVATSYIGPVQNKSRKSSEAATRAEDQPKTVRIAAAQPKSRLINWRIREPAEVLMQIDRSLGELRGIVDRAAAAGCDALAFPEDTLGLGTWLAANESLASRVLPQAVERMLREFGEAAARHRMYLICCNDVVEADGAIYNTAFFLGRDGKEIGRYHKVLPVIHERFKKAGTEFPVFNTPDLGSVGMLICYDMVFPEAARCLALGGVDIIFYPTLGGAAIGDDEISLAALRTRAVENFVYLVASQRGSGAMIVSPQGKVIARAEKPDGLAIAEINPFGGRDGGDAMNHQEDMRARLFRERSPVAFSLLTATNPPVLQKVPATISEDDAVRIARKTLTLGEEEFKAAEGLLRKGQTNDAIAAFGRLCREYPQTWIDRIARERLEKLGR